MNTPTPFHELAVRVYYEDTDFSGRVYHASYLRFMERGRTEWLRALGYEHGALAGEQGVVFAVRRLEIDYFAPAAIDDLLRVETRVAAVRGAAIDFAQTVSRGDKTSRRSEDPRRGAARRPADAHSASAAGAVGDGCLTPFRPQTSSMRSSRAASASSRSAMCSSRLRRSARVGSATTDSRKR